MRRRKQPARRRPRPDPKLIERLEEANALLAEAYETLLVCMPAPVALAIATQALEEMAEAAMPRVH